MARKTQKLKPDMILKNYWNDNERFADFFNAVLFGGEEVIKPEELESVDTEASAVFEHRKYAEGVEASRDGIKVCKKSSVFGIELVLLGMENQERIHYAMPMRIMGYDYGAYKKQYDSNAAKYRIKEGLTEDEFLSKMKADDRFVPVITVVVYYGEKAWDGAVSLHGMLNIPEKMKGLVNDYKMHLVEARKNNLTLHNMDNRDFFGLLEILLDKSMTAKEVREKAIEYAESNSVDESVVMTAASAADCVIDYDKVGKKGGEGVMCRVFEETRREGIELGRKEGEAKGEAKGKAEVIITMGHEFQLSESDILERLQMKLGISLNKAQEYLEMFGN